VENEKDSKSSFSEKTRVEAIKDQVSCDLSDETVVLSFQDGIYYGLNPVGTRIWDLIQEPRTVKDIRDSLLEEFEVEASRCERDLQTFLREMSARKLIVMKDETAA
jgi:hypothetical protein